MDLKLTTDASLAAILAPLVDTRQELKAQIAQLEAHVDSINDEIKTTLVNAGELEVTAAGHKITLDMEAEKSSLDKQKLVEAGVSTDQIKKATKVTTYIKLDVRKVKESAQ
jgi:hypothetical protein